MVRCLGKTTQLRIAIPSTRNRDTTAGDAESRSVAGGIGVRLFHFSYLHFCNCTARYDGSLGPRGVEACSP